MLSFDRLINFFKISHPRFNAIPFFFRYIRENSTLLSEKIETREFDIHALFHEEFEPELVKDLRNDELIEAISCVFQIFTVKKRFKSLLSYRQYFQEFKKEGQLKTELSLRKFITYMDWMKNSVLAPSYHINYAQFALACFEVKVRFNPLLRDSTITKILEEFPFLFSVTICQNSFSAELTLFFITPIKYREKAYAIFRRLQEAGYILGYQILLYN